MNGFYILKCEESNVIIGKVEPDPDDFERLILNDAAVVRRWGTTKGIGQLAIEGMQAETQLDLLPDGNTIYRKWVKLAIPVDEAKWPKGVHGS